MEEGHKIAETKQYNVRPFQGTVCKFRSRNQLTMDIPVFKFFLDMNNF